ncbi:Kelch repeat-containing protein [Kitasatospora sp. NPDC127111]|uniref:Kelch repeat-containing protein n=1 Tax=Kitasatospora sp. NPDC127111 TaxID=3345363 RepID=UPI00363EA040
MVRVNAQRWPALLGAFVLAATGAVLPDGAVAARSALVPACLAVSPDSGGVHDSWSSAAPTTTPRYFLAAATDCDGTVYALGGWAATTPSPGPSDFARSDLVENYDPGSGSWTTVPALWSARARLAAVTDEDGRIWAIGGGDDASSGRAVEVYTPGYGAWQATPSLPVEMPVPSAASDAAGNVYVFDGDETAIFDADSRTWRTGPPMPTPREGGVAATGADGRVYVIGGYTTAEPDVPTSTVEVYTPSTREWSQAAPMPGPKGRAAGATAPDGRIFVFGGASEPGETPTAVTYVYAPGTDRWEPAESMPHTRDCAAAAVGGDGRIYLVGGTEGDAVSTATTDVDVYTP